MLEQIYFGLISGKNFLYDAGLLDSVHCRIPVISVGNLSAGGAGKTPLVNWLLQVCQERKISAAVVARNYKAESQGVEEVKLNLREGPSYFGDEAYLLKQKNPDAGVWTGPQKFITSQYCDNTQKYQLILIDDGFQHRNLARDLDIVLLDASVDYSQYRLLPRGRLREPFQSLKRADMIIVTKVNWDGEGNYQKIFERIRNAVGEEQMTKVFSANYEISLQIPPQPNERFLLVSGIAQPHSLVKSLKEYKASLPSDFQLADHIVFPDHHSYGREDLERIERAQRELGCGRVLTTEKDLVKLSTLGAKSDIQALQLSIKFNRNPEIIYDFFNKVYRA